MRDCFGIKFANLPDFASESARETIALSC